MAQGGPAQAFDAAPLASFAALPGWAQDDHAEAFAVFRRSCAALLSRPPHPLAAPGLREACVAAINEPDGLGRAAARRFFERRFRPFEIRPRTGNGLLTGYYEPEFEGRRAPDARFRFPLLGRPDDLVPLMSPAERPPHLPAELVAARRTAEGGLEPYPDRGAIEDGALAGRGLELLWLADPFEVFIAQVQGSVRIRLDDGAVVRVGYAARNGYPYTSIGRALIERGHLPAHQAGLGPMRALFAREPELARDIMRLNRSYVFFRLIEDLAPELGPIGAQGVPLTPHRSIAVDRTVHAYGTPFYVVSHGAAPDGGALRRLAIAQDTGTAIVGPARVDWFAGSGRTAERQAGRLRNPLRLFILRPREPTP
jgi:membrane-bound lytic murein transglycosylase A